MKNPEQYSETNPFPVIMGNEEETGMQIRVGGQWEEPHRLLEALSVFLPAELRGSGMFLSNGFKVYAGGSKTDSYTNLERATPECASPQDVSKYIRAGELVLTALSRNFAELYSKECDTTVDVRIQRRVVDYAGNRKGCHDNYGFSSDSVLRPGERAGLPKSVPAYLATRSFITGAGHITSKEVRYSQKINGLSRQNGYGYFGSMYRVAESERDYPRIETRCNDINISEWAATARIGGAALLLAMLQTPLRDGLERRSRELLEYNGSAIDLAKRVNRLYIDRDGAVSASDLQKETLSYQRFVAEEALIKLPLYTDVPEHYYAIADEIYKYCDDYQAVLEGRKDLSVLTARSDWAAKMSIVIDRINKDYQYGLSGSLKSLTGQAADLRYDHMGISAEDGHVVKERLGTAYRLRDRGKLDPKFQHTEKEVARAYKNAPSDTRAALRSRILKAYHVSGCSWQDITVNDGKDSSVIHLTPLQTELFDEDVWTLREVREISEKIHQLFAL